MDDFFMKKIFVTENTHMDKTNSQFLILTLFLLLATIGYSQHKHSSQIVSPVLHHEVEIFIGNSHVPEASIEGSSATLVLPNIGINYKYWFDDRFAVGLYNNLVTRTFVINSDTHQDLEQKHPVTTTIVGIFRPWKKFNFFAGPGIMIDEDEGLFVIRLGLDYAFSLSNDWYLSPRFIFDNIGGDIESYTLGVSFVKNF